MESKKNCTNELYSQNRSRVTDVENKVMFAWGGGGKGKGGINRKLEIDRHTLLYVKQMTNKYLVYSTGEKEMAIHSRVLAWRIPGMAEPGGLPPVGSHRVGHD